jgi:hypothetical protein
LLIFAFIDIDSCKNSDNIVYFLFFLKKYMYKKLMTILKKIKNKFYPNNSSYSLAHNRDHYNKYYKLSLIFNKFFINFNKLSLWKKKKQRKTFSTFFEINYRTLTILVSRVPSGDLRYYLLETQYPIRTLSVLKTDLHYFAGLKGRLI